MPGSKMENIAVLRPGMVCRIRHVFGHSAMFLLDLIPYPMNRKVFQPRSMLMEATSGAMS